jgi:hypothetical protein
MELNALQTSLIAIVGGIAAIGGAIIWGHETEQIIISAAAVLIPAVIGVVAQLEKKTLSNERVALGTTLPERKAAVK